MSGTRHGGHPGGSDAFTISRSGAARGAGGVAALALVLGLALGLVALVAGCQDTAGGSLAAPASAAATDGADTGDPTGAAASLPPLGEITADRLAILLAATGLPLHTTVIFTAGNDPSRLLGKPGEYSSKIAFADPRVDPSQVQGQGLDAVDRGGLIEIFPNSALAIARVAELRSIAESVPIYSEYTYSRDRAVLRVSQILTPAQAAQYLAGLNRVRPTT